MRVHGSFLTPGVVYKIAEKSMQRIGVRRMSLQAYQVDSLLQVS
jgi:hypothetical protein